VTAFSHHQSVVKKESFTALLARITRLMAKPRVTKSARVKKKPPNLLSEEKG
jgi:hypothetical protein